MANDVDGSKYIEDLKSQNVKSLEAPQSANSVYAALTRTLMRGLALYMSRPVRLFRPSKVSGWSLLGAMARRDGTQLSLQYVSNLYRSQGATIISRYFIPPLIVNTALGAVLWTVYSETYSHLLPQVGNHTTLVASISGAAAGGAQAALAAPAENVRVLLEGRSMNLSWSGVWKEVFRIPTGVSNASGPPVTTRDARQAIAWTQEVRAMAGRGWDGWHWGVAKDIFGFAAFFAIFDLSRRFSIHAGHWVNRLQGKVQGFDPEGRQALLPGRLARASVLITGGVFAGICYEFIGRPFDTLRRMSHARPTANTKQIFSQALTRLRGRGIKSFFNSRDRTATAGTSRSQMMLRTLGRVGPWGCAFLIWETFGPGI